MKQRSGDPWWSAADPDSVHLIAAEWLTRLLEPNVSLDEVLAWQEWLEADLKHAHAFSAMEDLSLAMRRIKPPKPIGALERALDRYDASVSLQDWHRSQRRKPLALAASIVLGIALFAGMLLKANAPGPTQQVLATRLGENQAVELADGSTVILGGASRIAVSYDPKSRSIDLVQGEALFSVAKDAQRPFVVHAGNAKVVALGTQFNIRRGSDGAVVSVTEGKILVEPELSFVPTRLLQSFVPTLRAVRLDAGQQITADRTGVTAAVALDDPAATTSWQSGQLSFRSQPLRHVLEDVNRYSQKSIELEDESIGSVLITGTVANGNIAGWLDSLQFSFGLQGADEGDRIVIRRKSM